MSSIVFTTDEFALDDRVDAWNAAFGSLNEIVVPSDDLAVPCVRSENWLLGGGLVLSETRVARAQFVRDPRRTRRDQYDHWILRVVRRGQGHLVHPRFETTTRPGDLVIFPASDTWTNDWQDVEWVSLCIPRTLDPRLTRRLEELPPGKLTGAAAGLLSDIMLGLSTRVSGATVDEVPGLANIVLAALTASLPAPGIQTNASALGGATPAMAKERVRRAIMRDLRSTRLTPAFLANAAGLSRSAMYRLFEAEGGVARYVRNTRLSLAYEALQSAEWAHKSIAVIAEEHGFPDPPEFSRAFRSAFGITPSDARAAATSTRDFAPPPPLQLASQGPDVATRIYAGCGYHRQAGDGPQGTRPQFS